MEIATLPVDIRVVISPSTGQMLQRLGDNYKDTFVGEYRRHSKSKWIAFVLWLICLHYAYLGRWGAQVVFWLTAGGLLVWWFIDFYRVPVVVDNRNSEIAYGIARDMAATFP